jgi:hypothetical protein
MTDVQMHRAIGDLTEEEVRKMQLGDELLEQWASLQETMKTGTYRTSEDHVDSTSEHQHETHGVL